jgi:hypothetical protein
MLMEEHRLKVFENSVLRRIFGPKRDNVMRGFGKLIMRYSVICTLHRILG